MTIRYIANLTFEEQIHHWENGNSEEVKLAAWLQQRRQKTTGQQDHGTVGAPKQAPLEWYRR